FRCSDCIMWNRFRVHRRGHCICPRNVTPGRNYAKGVCSIEHCVQAQPGGRIQDPPLRRAESGPISRCSDCIMWNRFRVHRRGALHMPP
ncbi:MAG: hypothetical protein IJ461_05485, partial [Clostridia bacterium]|nr:hypothetical protein [Clostridia bacterium]